MDVPDPQVRAHQLSASSTAGQVRFLTYLQTMAAALLLVFWERLRSTTGTVFLIVDRLRTPRTPAVQAWVVARRAAGNLLPGQSRAGAESGRVVE
jgi:hypothetical protein